MTLDVYADFIPANLDAAGALLGDILDGGGK